MSTRDGGFPRDAGRIGRTSATKKDQAFVITYVAEERPDPRDLSVVRAVQKQATLWATDAREALDLFDLKAPRGVHYIVVVAPVGLDRVGFIEITDEERRRVAGAMLIEH